MLSAETAAVPQDLIWRMGVEHYHAMIRSGILTDDDPVELLEGWLVFKMPKNPPHRAATRLIREALESIIPADWYVDSQEPITLADSEPEPDVVVIRGDTRQYLDRHPGPGEVGLVIEVSDTTLQRGKRSHALGYRTSKKRAYARAGIPTYWIVNLPEKHIEAYSQPTAAAGATYELRQDYSLTSNIPVRLETTCIGLLPVNELLP
ncbi:Uma2 family endonuclease [Romeria aff. gracilis LEGE 07310]|uniref:Uma2 family endonuclease n=1 Tax=Vasconcelosia minhoensis LEGE 07310 TaxID=915328 RepID=A0A8J7AX20_9CYAN|nr:Uma2 family endonuclease [Romeria gracilis]MBE9077547.1 Uma2 family endonuclease [Romeria aff. gracilis LEGE 07310]